MCLFFRPCDGLVTSREQHIKIFKRESTFFIAYSMSVVFNVVTDNGKLRFCLIFERCEFNRIERIISECKSLPS